METCIYTFSGTGTALSIADQVRDGLGNATVELIPQLLRNTAAGQLKADAPGVGFVFPNYFGGIPDAVLELIQKLNMDNVQYIFAIVPSGGGKGYQLNFLKKELERKGKKLNYGRYVKGGSNYIVAGYYESISKPKRLESVLASLHEKVAFYTEEIKRETKFVDRSSRMYLMVNRLLSSFTPKEIREDTSDGDREYRIGDACTGCGICQKVCQANNIVMADNTPSFQHKCYRCMACIQYCPQNAILFNGKELNKPKYTHPDFPAGKMIRRIQNGSDCPLLDGESGGVHVV